MWQTAEEFDLSRNMNEKLLVLQKDWLSICDAEGMAEKYPLSRPFLFGVTEHYMQSKNTIMIIGQEAKDFSSYKSDWPLSDIQHFNECYVNTQLDRPVAGYKYNRSPFWRFFRELANEGIEPVWNNLDKFHQIINGKTSPLSLKMENVFSRTYGNDNKSLLQREIELTKPTLVLFVTGPNYHESMATALGIDDRMLQEYRPTVSTPCQQFTKLTNMDIPLFWSYHPAYLSRRRAFQDVIARLTTTRCHAP